MSASGQAVQTVTNVFKARTPEEAEQREAQRRAQRESETEIKARIRRILETKAGFFEFTTDAKVNEIYGKLVQELMTAELTLNFSTVSVPKILGSGRLLNMWQIGGANIAMDEKYNIERNATEMMAFNSFDPSAGGESSTAAAPPQDPALRPVYMALSVGNFLPGGAPNYGQSYMVFKDAIKMRCTYTATDTIQMAKTKGKGLGPDDVQNYSSLPLIMNRITDRYLEFLVLRAKGESPPKVLEFIEAQVFSEVSLSDDVKTIVISERDLARLPGETSKKPEHIPADWVDLSKAEREAKVAELKTQIETFCAKNGIELQYLPLDGTTMNSTAPRPPAPRPPPVPEQQQAAATVQASRQSFSTATAGSSVVPCQSSPGRPP